MANESQSDTFLRIIVPGNKPRIDIVAIHGLNPRNKERHAERTWESDGKIWLRDFLPKQLPHARVLLFGYNSNVCIRSSAAGVREQAQNLLNRLWLERQDCEDRPIIFIAHSLGGIVVKEALVQAKLGVMFNSIQTSTYGIVFFGTPHHGSHLARMGDAFAKAVRGFLKTPSNTFMEALKKDELYASELSANFQQLLEDYKYLNFYESLPLKSMGLIVEKSSAILGLPDSREITVAVNGDHESICRFSSEDDENYKQVSGLIVKFANLAMDPSSGISLFGFPSSESTLIPDEPELGLEPKICMIPYTRNAGFVGREANLQQLRDRITPFGKSSRVALFGLGGVGKSQIAIEFAHQICAESPQTSIFWVSASSIDRFREGYNGIFNEHISSDEDEKCHKMACVREWLEGKREEWLLIIDNADETSLFMSPKELAQQKQSSSSILDFLPECPHGAILITTRNRAAAVKFTKSQMQELIEVQPMTSEESKCLVKHTVTDNLPEETEIDELSDLLGHLPLAIVQAAAFMQENSLSVSEYIDLYNDSDETRMDLLCEPFETLGRDTDVPNAVVTTLIVSIDQIKERDPKAIEILGLIAFLDRNDIPKSLVQQKIKRPLELTKALGTLKAFSLIVPVDKKGDIALHRLVQLVLRKWLIIENEFEAKCIEAMKILSDIYPNATYENWGICAAYLPHAQSVLSLAPELDGETLRKRLHLQEGVAYYFWSQGHFDESEKLDVLVVEEKKREFGLEHPETLESMAGLASTYHDQARWSEAEELDKYLLEMKKKLFGPQDGRTLTSMSNLASTFESQGRLTEATELRLAVYEMNKSSLGPNKEETIDALANLGSLYMDLGRLEEALELTRHAWSWRQREFGAEHRFTLTAASTLSRIYKALGNIQEAEALALQTLETSEAALGETHPETRTRMLILADIYQDRGDLDKAEELLLRMAENSERRDHLHFDMLNKKLYLADIYWAKGLEEKARKLEDEALGDSFASLGPEHPFTLKCLYFKAITQRRQHQDTEAIQLLTLVASKEEKVLGPYHDDTLQSVNKLAEWCGREEAVQRLLDVENRPEPQAVWSEWVMV